jgi:PAS domain S-box-containing protein
MSNVPNGIHEYFSNILDMIESSIYWKDKDGVYLGCNKLSAQMVNLDSPDEIIGKTDYDLFNKEAADIFRQHDLEVINNNTVRVVEETRVYNGKEITHLSSKRPLLNKKGEIIGIVGSSVEITAQKEAEQLKRENETYLAEKKAQSKFIMFIDKIMSDIQNFRIEALSEKLGTTTLKITDLDKQIRLTKREREVLYLLSLNKSPKDMAAIISMLEDKEIQDSTINGLINKQLYKKFEVFNVGQLIEKANALKLIPFLPG